jgi:hypothetical protein
MPAVLLFTALIPGSFPSFAAASEYRFILCFSPLYAIINTEKNSRRSNFRVTSGFQEVNSGMEKTRRIKDWDTKIVSKRWGFR